MVFVGRDPAGRARFATLRGTRTSEDGSRYIREVVLHLDNDEAGRRASAAISARLKEQGCTVYDMVPREGKDWNDYLCLRMGLTVPERVRGDGNLVKDDSKKI